MAVNRAYKAARRLFNWIASDRFKKIRLAFYLSGLAWLIFHVPNHRPANMLNFSKELRTHCVGRYLVDLPVDLGDAEVALAQLYFGLDADFKYVEVRVPKSQPPDFDAFWKKVNQTLKELQIKKNTDLNISMLLAKRVVPTPNGNALIIRMLSNDYSNVTTIISELHAFVGGRYIVLRTESYPEDRMKTRNVREQYKIIDPAASEDRLIVIAELMRPAGVPLGAKNGFCIAGVLFDPERMGYSEEKADFEFSTNNGDDPRILLAIEMEGMRGYETETLHERTDQIGGILLPFILQVVQRTVRRRDRKIEGVLFQEWANEIYYRMEKSHVYSFSIQNMRPATEDLSFERPAITVNMNSGVRHGTSPYSLDQLEAGWDQWLSTLRLSPGNGGKRL